MNEVYRVRIQITSSHKYPTVKEQVILTVIMSRVVASESKPTYSQPHGASLIDKKSSAKSIFSPNVMNFQSTIQSSF